MVESTTTPTTTKTTSFPVVLYDGNHETPVGNIEIHANLVFKSFQTKLAEMTGISYNNLTTYLVDSTKLKNSPDRRKILITGKVKFSVIVTETDCYFFVVLKRSRRERRRKGLKYSDFDGSDIAYDDLSGIKLNRKCLSVKHSDFNELSQIMLNRNGLSDDWFHDVLMSRVNRLNRGEYMKMIWNSRYEFEFDSNVNVNVDVDFPAIEDAYPRVPRKGNRLMCEDCTVAEKHRKSPEFHLCVYDDVVVGLFRSLAGPICRPR